MILKPVEEQVVAVIGASSGIGKETALQFARRGAKVVVSSRNEEGLNELVETIQSEGGRALAVPADVTSFEQMQNVAQQAVEHFGWLDTWAHVAGIGLWATFEDTEPEEFEQLLRVNLLGLAYGFKAAYPYLKRETRGALIGVSSVEGKRAMPYQSAYAASKHGVVGLLDVLRMEIERENLSINVVNILPAAINTPIFSNARTKLGVKPKGMPPIYEPSIVADAIVYAAEHPARDLYAGGAGKVFALGQALAPSLLDKILLLTGFSGQRTDEPKSADAPSNFLSPDTRDTRIKGDFTDQSKAISAYTWLETHPQARAILASAALGLAFALLNRQRRQ